MKVVYRTSLALGLAAAAAAGARQLLGVQARAARAAIGKPLGEASFHPDRTYRRKHGDPITLVMLGDSLAAGLGATRQRHTLGVQLAKRLGSASGRAVRLVPGAEVGAESSWLARQIDALPDDLRPDVAVIVVGGNDVTHRVRLADSVADLEDAIVRLRALGAQVVVGTCPDLGALVLVPQPLRALARQASRRLAFAQRDTTLRNGGHPVSLADAVAGRFVTDPEEMFALDRFHPSSTGYRRMARAMLPSVLASLEPPAAPTDVPEDRHGSAGRHFTVRT